MAGLSVYFTGISEFVAKMESWTPAVEVAGVQTLYRLANEVFAESQIQTPVDTGTLRSSGHVTPPVAAAGHIVVEIGYGGAAREYAYWVHERLDLHHAPPTKAKYLEDPVVAAIPRMTTELGGSYKVTLEGMGR